MDRPEVRERIHEVRREELARAAEIIGYDEVVLLGYRDSGMPDSEDNAHPDNFANAPLSTRPWAAWSRSSAASGRR